MSSTNVGLTTLEPPRNSGGEVGGGAGLHAEKEVRLDELQLHKDEAVGADNAVDARIEQWCADRSDGALSLLAERRRGGDRRERAAVLLLHTKFRTAGPLERGVTVRTVQEDERVLA